MIRRETASGPGFYRYGTYDRHGRHRGRVRRLLRARPDRTARPTASRGRPATSAPGTCWPVLSGERAEQLLQTGDRAGATALLAAMSGPPPGIGLMPEQAWENPDLAASPFGTDPATASIGFVNGEPAGSASPLTWAQAQQARLILEPRRRPAGGAAGDRPPTGTSGPRPPGVAAGDRHRAGRRRRTVTTADRRRSPAPPAPGATVDIAVHRDRHRRGDHASVTVTAGPDGAFAATVPAPFGTSVVTVAATTRGGATGYARRTVIGEFITGHHRARRDRPGRRRQRPGHVRVPDVGQLPARRVRPAAVPGDRGRRQRPAAGRGPRPVADLRLAARRAAARRLRARPGLRRRPRPRRRSRAATTRSPPTRPGAGGSRCRASPTRCSSTPPGSRWARSSVQASQASGYITIVVPAAALGTPGARLDVRGRAARPGRVQPRPGPRLRADPAGLPVRRVRAAAGPARSARSTRAPCPRRWTCSPRPASSQADELDPTAPPVEITGVPVG